MNKCCKSVWHEHRSYPCEKNAKYEVDGRWYCGTHNPVAAADRERRAKEERERKYAADSRRWNGERQMREVVRLAVLAVERHWADASFAELTAAIEKYIELTK